MEVLGSNHSFTRKFSRDDDQILALNYENLCDAEYLYRLFLPDTNIEPREETTGGSTSSWILNDEMPDDMILFGEADDLGKEFLFKKILNELPIEVQQHEPLTALVFRQVRVFDYISELILKRCMPTESKMISKDKFDVNGIAKGPNQNPSIHHLASRSLNCILRILEKQSRNFLKLTAIEPIISLLIKTFQTTTPMTNDKFLTLPQQPLLASVHAQLLRCILCNGALQGLAIFDRNGNHNHNNNNSDSEKCREAHESINLALSTSYGLLLIGMYTGDPGNVLLAVTHLLAINIRAMEKMNEKVTTESVPSVDKVRLRTKLLESKAYNSKAPGMSAPSALEDVQSRDQILYDGKLASLKLWEKPVISKLDKDNAKTKLKGGSRGPTDPEDSSYLPLPRKQRALAASLSASNNINPPTLSESGSNKGGVNLLVRNNSLGSQSSSKQQLDNQLRKSKLAFESMLQLPKSVVRVVKQCHRVYRESVADDYARSTRLPGKYGATTVWTCGQNSCGELGLSDATQRKSFTKAEFLEGHNVVGIGAGNEHSVFMTSDGRVFVSGYNDNGQCGVGTTNQVRSPTLVSSLQGEEIAQVHVYNGCEHTLLVTKEGKLMAFGYNYRGQLGLGNTSSEHAPRPVRTLLSRRVITAACSYHHSMVLCSDGAVFSFGRNEFGQLGHGDTIDKKTPHQVPNLPNGIISLSCGQFHSVLLTSAGQVYSCGKNDYGQLGLEGVEVAKYFTLVTLVPETESIVQIYCGYYHTLFLSQNGVVYGCGRNDHGQLGLGHSQMRMFGCNAVPSLRDKNVISIAAGCYHSVVNTSNGMLYVFGRNNHGQLGTGDLEERLLPHPVDDFVGRKVVSVAAGFYHTLVLTECSGSGGAHFEDLPVESFCAVSNTGEPSGSATKQVKLNNAASGMAIIGSTSNGEADPSSVPTSSPAAVPTSLLPGDSSNEDAKESHEFSLESRSGTTIREIIVPLVEHLHLMERQRAASTGVALDLDLSPTAIDWVTRQVRSYAMLLELCRRYVTMSQGPELPFTKEEAIKLLRVLIITTELFMNNNHSLFATKFESTLDSSDGDLESAFKFPPRAASRVLTAADILREIHPYRLDTDAKQSEKASTNVLQNEASTCLLRESLVWLRRELLHAYFHLPSTVDVTQSVSNEAANCLCKCFDSLFPSYEARVHFFTTLSDSLSVMSWNDREQQQMVMSSSTSSLSQSSYATGALDPIKCLRLFSRIFFKYSQISEVMSLFKTSPKFGLLIFRKLLNVYGHISMICLDTKLQQQRHQQLQQGRSSMLHHAVVALEHCCSNFVKCAIPIVLNKTKNNDSYLAIGVDVIRHIIETALHILDAVTGEPITEDIATILRFGTVLPGVLPTVLLFGIGNSASANVFEELLPMIRSLLSKLQQIGKSEYDRISQAISVPPKSTTTLPVSPSKRHTIKSDEDVSERDKNQEADGTVVAQKKEIMLQTSWWSRLLKFTVILSAKLASSLVSNETISYRKVAELGQTSDDDNSNSISNIVQHKLWKYCYTPSSIVDVESIEEMVKSSADVSERVRLCCKTLRDRENVFNHTYRVVWQAAKLSNTQADVEAIEVRILDAVISLEGESHLLPTGGGLYEELSRLRLRPIWSAITSVTKLIQSKRSNLVTHTSLPWREVLGVIRDVISALRCFIYKCIPRTTRTPLPKCRRVHPAFRRAMLLIICCSRWKACRKINLRKQGESVVDFFTTVLELLVFPAEEISAENVQVGWTQMIRGISQCVTASSSFANGLKILGELTGDVSFPSVKADIVHLLTLAYRKRLLGIHNSFNQMKVKKQKSNLSDYCHLMITVCSDYNITKNRNRHLTQILNNIAAMINEFSVKVKDLSIKDMTYASQNDLLVVTVCIKFLDFIVLESSGANMIATSIYAQLPAILMRMDEKLLDFQSSDDRGVSRRAQARERAKFVRKACGVIVNFIQNMSVHIAGLGVDGRAGLPVDAMMTHAQLLTYLQRSRLTATFSTDQDTRLKQANSPSEGREGKRGGKDGGSAHRKRCQELISRPLQFSRTQEGHAVPVDKLITSNKGIDFTLSVWLYLTKKPAARLSFIAGRLSNSDAWPALVYRGSENKLELVYGRSGDYERLISQATVQLFTWIHVAIIVETKKIKLFINGTLDGQVNTGGNQRVTAYPVVLGSSPLAFRSRVEQVRDGFDGLLANFKYYTRALSPIHVKVIYDQGSPEASDARERWTYQLLASCRVIIDAPCSATAGQALRSVADVLHLIFVTDTGRLRNAALKILERILALDFVDDITLSPNAWAAPTSSPQPLGSTVNAEVSVVGAPFLSEYSCFREKLVLYFIRMIGCCWSPGLALAADDCHDPKTLLKQPLNEKLVDFFQYAPYFVGERVCPARSTVIGSGPCVLDKSASREELTAELCQLLTSMLRNLTKERWQQAFSAVLYGCLNKFRKELTDRRGDYRHLILIDMLGAAVFLGEAPSGAYVGSLVEGYYCDSVARVLSIDKITGQATLLSQSTQSMSRQLLVVKTTDVTGYTPPKDKFEFHTFTFHCMLELMDALRPYVQVLLTDLVCMFRPDHSFLRNTLLRSVRPVEVFIFYQLMRYLSRAANMLPSEVRLRQNLFHSMVQFCVRVLRTCNTLEETSTERLIPVLWTKCAKHLSTTTERVISADFPPPEGERNFMDFCTKQLGISGDVFHHPPNTKMMKAGALCELLHHMANQGNTDVAASMKATGCDVVLMNDNNIEFTDADAHGSLRLLYHLRRGIIQLSRNLLTVPLVDEATYMQMLRPSMQMMLWHCVAQIRATQHPVPLGHLMFTMCLRLHGTQRLEVTHSLASSIRYAAISYFQMSINKSVGNIVESTDLFSRLIHAAYAWINYHVGDTFEIEVCFQFLKMLLPALNFVEEGPTELQMLQLCRQALHRILMRLQPTQEPPKELQELAKSNNFNVLWSRSQEHLLKERGTVEFRLSPVTQNIVHLAVGCEIIQRWTGGPSKLLKSASANNPVANCVPNPPKVLVIRSTLVELDLHFCLSRMDSLGPGVVLEVAIGVLVEGELDIFETVYRGTSSRLSHSGLSPGCAYTVRCRALQGAICSKWSPQVDFQTENAPLFSFDPLKCGPEITIGDGGLSAVYNGDDCWSTVLGTHSMSCGVCSWEIRVVQSSTAYIFVGVARSCADLHTFLGGCSNGWGFIGEQALYHNREKVKVYGDAFSSGDVIGVILDFNNGTLSFARNGKSLGVAFDKIHGELFPAVAFYNQAQQVMIVPDGGHISCPHEPIPSSISRVNMDEICLLTDLFYSMNNNSPLPYRILEMTAEHCAAWTKGTQVRKRAVSGRGVFLCTKSNVLKFHGLKVGERLRTPYGVATVSGSAYGRVWYSLEDSGTVWFFATQQISNGREKGLFQRCTYEVDDRSSSPSSSSTVQESFSQKNQDKNQKTKNSRSSGAPIPDLAFDAMSLQDLLDPSKWTEEMDGALVSFLIRKADSKNVSPWDITSDEIYNDFRSIQRQLTRIVIANADLSHRWGIAGPKRRAVIARVGMLRVMNDLLERYLQIMSLDVSTSSLACTEKKPVDDFTPIVCTRPGPQDGECSITPLPPVPFGAYSSRAHGHTVWPIINLSWSPLENKRKFSSILPTARHLIFTDIKLRQFWEILSHSMVRASKTDDDYDYPEDLPQVHLNRFKSFRAREASEQQKISGEDFIYSSLFCQLWKELRQHPPEKLRISYTHPMDDGQSRTFKVKFDNEGVDDYGGPYREVFQQLCEELQLPDPSDSKAMSERPSSWATTAPVDDSSSSNTPPARCFLPLLHPSPNWTAGECEERYKYIFNSSSTSPVRLDLFRFLGQIVGIAIRSKITLDLPLASVIWKSVVREPLGERDIASFDAPAAQFVTHLGSLYLRVLTAADGPSALASVREEAQTVLQDLNWTATRSDGRVVELVPGGSKKSVVLEELGLYLKLYVESRLSECSASIEAFREGLLSIIPESAIALLTWEELQKLVCGVRRIDVDRLKANTEYDDDLFPEDPHIVAFWEVLREFSEEEKSAFLRFVWARPTLPPKGVELPQKLKIQSAVGEDASLKPDQYLPKAHTCFFSVNLPRYSSKEVRLVAIVNDYTFLYVISDCDKY